ncbi:MAG: SDR family NAD(P)-dependent oxidoreductase, partial [Parafilimonas terrae]|nr:SDR family NAD(P)-dependent oxidoreductase [Parafilimonas terrae]
MKPVLLTGAAGFIGFHVAQRYLREGRTVLGIDDLNDYYDVALKESRLARLATDANFTFRKVDLADRAAIEEIFRRQAYGTVIHLGAQAGVR